MTLDKCKDCKWLLNTDEHSRAFCDRYAVAIVKIPNCIVKETK